MSKLSKIPMFKILELDISTFSTYRKPKMRYMMDVENAKNVKFPGLISKHGYLNLLTTTNLVPLRVLAPLSLSP